VAEQFVVLYDMEGWRLSHSFHLRKVYAHISTLQAHSRLQQPIPMSPAARPVEPLAGRRGPTVTAGRRS
jgi:hypothetical protein